MTRLVIPRADRPLASVVMVTYGGWQWTRRALEALRDHTDRAYEVIVVDNDSPDGTAARLRAEVEGVDLVANDRNLGFGPANNQGAARARGRFVVLLNNDAIVRPGWLPPLIEAVESPMVGAAVPRLLNLDGTLQEAGSLVWSDGSTWALGNGADPTDPAYRFPRTTDYGSAACMVLRRSMFLEAGGFDPAYVPAYCEDVDLQLRLRRRALRTAFVPRSEVVHVRFGASSESTAARLILANRRILVGRWREVLSEHPPPYRPGREHRLFAGRDRTAADRVLVAAVTTPRALLEGMAASLPAGRITFLALGPLSGRSQAEALAEGGVEVARPIPSVGRWMRDRLFHYSAAVVLGPEALEAVWRGLRDAQPQASLVYVMEAVPSARPIEAEALPIAEAVLCPTEERRREAGAAGAARAEVMEEGRLAEAVASVLPRVGVVGPLVAEGVR